MDLKKLTNLAHGFCSLERSTFWPKGFCHLWLPFPLLWKLWRNSQSLQHTQIRLAFELLQRTKLNNQDLSNVTFSFTEGGFGILGLTGRWFLGEESWLRKKENWSALFTAHKKQSLKWAQCAFISRTQIHLILTRKRTWNQFSVLSYRRKLKMDLC